MPDAPEVYFVEPGLRSATFYVGHFGDGGSSPVTHYVIARSNPGSAVWTTVSTDVPITPPHLVTGLQDGTTYSFRAAAVNAAGQSAWSASRSVKTFSVPSAPGVVRTSVDTTGLSLYLEWDRPSNEGDNSSVQYVLQRFGPDTGSWLTIATFSELPFPPYKATGLTPGVRHYFRVAARNSVGQGPWSPIGSGVPIGPPSAPRSVFASARPGSALLTWAAPATTYGQPILGYVVERSVAGTSAWTPVDESVERSPFTVRGLEPGVRYSIRIAAVTSAGQGQWSSATVVPAPIGLTATITASRTSVRPGDNLLYTIRVTNQSAWTIDNVPVTVRYPDLTYLLALTWDGPNIGYAMPWASRNIQWALGGIGPGVTVTLTFTIRVGDVPPGPLTADMTVSLPDAMVDFSSAASTTALAGSPVRPSAPKDVQLYSGSDWVVITWGTPAYFGSSTIDGYVVQRSTSFFGPWTTVATLGAGARSWADAPLTDVRWYHYRIAAFNDAGIGEFSPPEHVT